MGERFDFAVIGGGMAGASVAHELAGAGRVVLLERESRCGYHSTGRSAALYTENYGNDAIRRLTAASRPFLDRPPPGFAEHPLLSPRDVIWAAPSAEAGTMEKRLAEAQTLAPGLRLIDAAETYRRCPVLRQGEFAGAILETGGADMDVAAIHQGYLKLLRRRGGEVRNDAEARGIESSQSGWRIVTAAGTVEANVIVNAAGAWAEEIGRMAGAGAIGLVPKRRTALTFDPPTGADPARWPMVAAWDESFYFKPEAGRILASPADETPVPPCDVQPEEIDIARCIDRVERMTTMKVRRVAHKWAGLRSFVADKSPVAGWDRRVENFFWLAGQGGYGIMTAPALARLAFGLIVEGAIPKDLAAAGIAQGQVSPARLA